MSEATNTCTDPEQGRLLAAYELGVLPAEEALACEEHLSRCEACLEELYAHAPHAVACTAHASELLGSMPRTRTGEEGHLASEGRSERQSERRAPAWRRRRWDRRLAFPVGVLAAAAAIAIVLRGVPGPLDVADLAELEPVAYVPMGLRGSGAGDAFDQGMRHYAAGRYAAAARDLEAALGTGGSDPARRDQVQFFLGVSHLLAGDSEAALPYLDGATNSSQPVIADRARWYLAQLHLLRNAPEPALDLLDGLAVQSPGYATRAARLAAAVRTRVSSDVRRPSR